MRSKDFILSYFNGETAGLKDEQADLETLLFPSVEESSMLLARIDSRQYVASAAARAVEDCDAHLLNLNVLHLDADGGWTTVALRVDHRNSGAVARSLERYGFEVIATATDGDDNGATDPDAEVDPAEEKARRNAAELLRYLSI